MIRIGVKGLFAGVALGLASVSAGSAQAAVKEAWDFATESRIGNSGDWDFGAIFSVNTTETVVALGYLDTQGDSNPVVLYQCSDLACDGTGTAIASATVTSSDPIIGNFRFASISSVTLSPNVGYEVVGPTGSNRYTADDDGFFANVNYTPFTDQWALDAGTAFLPNPTGCCETSDGFWGPNVLLSDSTIPEPSTWAMMLLGFAGLGLAGYRHGRRRGSSSEGADDFA